MARKQTFQLKASIWNKLSERSNEISFLGNCINGGICYVDKCQGS